MGHRKFYQGFILITALFVLSACTQPPLPKDHYYRLGGIVSEGGPITSPLKGIVEVDRFLADGLVGGRSLLFTEAGQEQEVQEYHYHLWTEGPTSLIQDSLIAYLRDAKVADNIITPEMRLNPDFAINGRIRHLERIIGGKQPKVLVELEIGLKSMADDKLVFIKSYSQEVTHKNENVSTAVAAMNQAVASIFKRFIADIQSR
ncbi:MAG: PqiC family protein [Alphaproteobacteria bacterium]|nr:PqiC family protein [Rhodospirillales bacterium]MCW9045002.1 PqiC family protein [Alphaproteobacteria bacterium]